MKKVDVNNNKWNGKIVFFQKSYKGFFFSCFAAGVSQAENM